MGLLDDAIREHLELKRLSGADPGAVAREEQDALGPVGRESESRQGEQDSERLTPDAERSFPDFGTTPPDNHSTGSQETIEINMEAELAAETDHEQERQPREPVTSEESLEWEVPSNRPEEPPVVTRHQGGPDSPEETDEPLEDVLEETPDFLRDTPEQERLWFEQRPPRDFDFNE